MDVYVSFLSNLILRNDIQICETFVQESGYVVGLLQYFRINICIDKCQQLFENALDTFDLLQI